VECWKKKSQRDDCKNQKEREIDLQTGVILMINNHNKK
jgi:hypothetical protein